MKQFLFVLGFIALVTIGVYCSIHFATVKWVYTDGRWTMVKIER